MTDELHEMSSEKLTEEQSTILTAGISDLQEMHTRLKAVEKAVAEEMDRLVKQESNKNINKIDASVMALSPLIKKRRKIFNLVMSLFKTSSQRR